MSGWRPTGLSGPPSGVAHFTQVNGLVWRMLALLTLAHVMG